MNTVHAESIDPETPVDPIDPDDYVVRQISGSGSVQVIFPNGYQVATINSSGSANIDSLGYIDSYSLSTSAYISNGEGYPSASVQITNLSYSNNGTNITVNYTVRVTAGGSVKSASGSFTVY